MCPGHYGNVGTDFTEDDFMHKGFKGRLSESRFRNDVAALYVRLHIQQSGVTQGSSQFSHWHPIPAGWSDAPQKDCIFLHCVPKLTNKDAQRKSHRLAGFIGESVWTAGLGVASRKLCAPSEANSDLEIGILNDVALNVERVVLRHSLKAKGELLKIAEDRKAGGVVLGHDNLSLERSAIGLVRADVGEPSVPAENPPSFKNCDTGTSTLKV